MRRFDSRRGWWVLAMTLVAVLMAAGCGSDEPADDGDGGTADGGDSADSGGDTADTGGDGGDGEGAGGDDGASDGDGGDVGGDGPAGEDDDAAVVSFADVFSRGGEGRLAVTYEGTDETGESFEMTLANQPPASVVLFAFDGVDGRLISPGDGTFVSCTEVAGTWQCLQFGMPGSENSEEMFGAPVPFLLDQDGINAAVPGWSGESSTEILGRSAVCASTSVAFGSAGSQDGRSEVCVDAETGMVLSWDAEFGDGASSTVQATAIGEPDPTWFEPPAEPMSMEDMMRDAGG